MTITSYHWLLDHTEVKIIDVSTSTATEDATGGVKGGFTRIRGYLGRIVLRKRIASVDHDYHTLATKENLEDDADPGSEYPYILDMDIEASTPVSIVYFILLVARRLSEKKSEKVDGRGLVLEHVEQEDRC
jgi:hypothetical protein